MRGSSRFCARALVLAAALVLTSFSLVSDGLRTSTTPSASGSSPAAGSGRLDGYYEPNPTTATVSLHGSGKTEVDEDGLAPPAGQRVASGSRLPDCAHACGACSPCRRVMVGFKCAQVASEACPVAYRCMCRGRFFRVPYL